jgi:hypothetical protein
MAFQRHPEWRFNGLLTALREFMAHDRRQNPVLSVPLTECRLSRRRRTTMKNFIILTALAVLTIGNAIAAMPGAASSSDASAARNGSPLMTAEMELPFDRYWSKN